MMDVQEHGGWVTLTASADNVRVDHFVAAALPALSRTQIQRLIKAGEVVVEGRPCKPSYRLTTGEIVRVHASPPSPPEILAEEIALEILYEDDDLVAINKPAGMVVHPAYGNTSGTLVNAALARWPRMQQVGEEGRAGVVHRIDKDTSGVLVMAKTPAALAHLQRQFKTRTVCKRYLALVEGIPSSASGVIEAPIGRDPRQRKRMAVVRDGRPSVTRYDLMETLGEHALLALELHTGRTHQIRVHLAWLGHPLVGDRVYGYRKQRIGLNRLFLHAAELQVDSPATGERLVFKAPLPADLEEILAGLRRSLSAGWD
jgi:23S rRNA pseudouridine1911/1915/1917 synthase